MKSLFACATLAIALLPFQDANLSQRSAAGPVRWAEGAPNATSEVKDENKIEGLKTDDVQIFISFTDIKDTEYNRVWIQIANHSKAPFDFDPQSAILLNTDKDKSVRAEVPDKAAKSIEKFGEAKSQELSSAHCENMIATQCQPTVSQMQMSKQVAAYAAHEGEWVRNNAITLKSLPPGEEAKGYIYFKKDKKKANYILKISVASQVFEFPVSADNKAPSYD